MSQKPGKPVLTVLRTIGVIAIFAIMLHTLMNVAGRYLFDAPVPGTHELVTYWYLPILAFVGFVLAKQAAEVIEAPLIFDNLSWANRRLLVIVNSVAAVATCVLFAYFTFVGEALHGAGTGATAGVSTIPIWPVLFLPPLVFAALAVLFAVDAVNAEGGRFATTAEDRPDRGAHGPKDATW